MPRPFNVGRIVSSINSTGKTGYPQKNEVELLHAIKKLEWTIRLKCKS